MELQYLVWVHFRTGPVVQVEIETFVTNAEFELFQKNGVFHVVQSRK